MIKVGGRLKDSPPYTKLSMILLTKHPLTKLIILHFYQRDLHTEPSALSASIREQYWIISARNTIHSILRKFVTYFRLRPVSLVELMKTSENYA